MCRYASLFLAAVLTLAIVTTAARAEEIKNEYFSLNIPTGWVTSAGPSQNGAVTVLVQNTKDIVALSISVTPAPMPARELVEQTVKNMRFGGTRVEQPVQQGDSFVIGFEQRRREVKGMSYFTSNGSQGSSITIMVRLFLFAYPNGDNCVPVLLNSFVHMLMYTHYLCSILGFKCWWRSYLTKLQLVQFVLITLVNVVDLVK